MFLRPNLRLTRRIPFNLICAVLIFLAASKAANADELAIWNFNDSDLNVDHGSGTLTSNINVANILFAAGTTTNARQGDTAGQALSLQGGTGNCQQWQEHHLCCQHCWLCKYRREFCDSGNEHRIQQ